MLGIAIWQPSEMNEADILLVLHNDREAFDYFSEIYNKFKIYHLGINSNSYAQMICSVLAMENNINESFIPSDIISSNEHRFLSLFCHATKAYALIDKVEFEKLQNEIFSSDYSGKIYDTAKCIVEYLSDVLDVLYYGLFVDGIYYSSSSVCWWRSSPGIWNKLSELHVNIERSNIPIKNLIKGSISGLQRYISIFNSRDTAKIHKLASSYFMFLARYYFKKCQHTVAYLAVHRAIDLYFTSIAIENGKIVELCDFIIYQDDDPNNYSTSRKPSIHLFRTYKYYIKNILQLDSNLDSAVYQINTKRNKLMLAHGVESASDTEYVFAYDNAFKILEADIEWRGYKNCFDVYMEINIYEHLSEIFNINYHIVS